MFRLTLKSIAAKKARFLLTGVAVILGVAFMAGTLVLTDTIKKSYDELAGNVYEDTDAVVRSSSSVKGDDGADVRGSVDAAVLEHIRNVPGVDAAEGELLGIAMVVGHDGELLDASDNRAPPIALAWQGDERLNPMELVDGHAPVAGEVVIDQKSFEKGGFEIGETLPVLTKAGAQEFTLAGYATYGGKEDAVGAQVVAFSAADAPAAIGTDGKFDSITVAAVDGVSESEVAANIERALGTDAGLEVLTGTQAIEDAREAVGAQMSFFNTFLLTFAIVGLLVGSFVIYNTFSITVAQRTRETALLRAIGAKRKQVMRSIVFESLLTGVVASAIGVVFGIATAKGIANVFEYFDIKLPASGTVVNAGTVVISMVVGTLVTVFAAYFPARKAGKVRPIAALRDVSIDRSGASWKRAALGTGVTVLGATFLGMGLSAGEVSSVGIGAMLVFAGVSILGPVIARPFARLIGTPLPRLRGMAGTLARENATRNPRRTSATASALMIGVGLVAFITVFAASTKASINKSVDTSVNSDWVVETAWGMGGLSPDAAQRIDALPETGTVTALRYAASEIDGSGAELMAFDPAQIDGGVDLKATSGDLSALGLNELAVEEGTAEDNGWELGTQVPVTFPETGEQTFTVTALYSELGPSDGYAISLETFEANVSDHVDNYLAVNTASGVSTEAARNAIESVLDDYPNADLMTRDEFKGSIAAEIDSMLNLIYVLLFMALAIALFGIANTLALSVYERTREIGLLRAVGMSRAQVRASVRWESVLIALLGTVLGMGIGLGFGAALVDALSSQGIDTLQVPTTQLVWIAAIAAVAATVAAALPARRAAKLDVLSAITTD